MKITHSRARRLEITISVYSPARGLRPVYCMREDSRSRIRRAESGHRVFGKGAISLFWLCYVWKFRGFLCFAFFVVLLLSNPNKIL